MPRRKTQVEVIKEFQTAHGDRYDYSRVVYRNSATKVEVACKTHGIFSVQPTHHKNGVGCRKCFFESQKLTKNEFISSSQKHFGSRYDYSLFDELPSPGEKVEIRCLVHDVTFMQEPRNHQRGHVGCPRCKSLKHALKGKQLTSKTDESELTEKFRMQAQEVHGNRYCYDEFQYVNVATKAKIVCPDHGAFFQNPSNHLRGSGCPECARDSLKADTLKQQCKNLGVDYWRALKRRQAGMSSYQIFEVGYVRSLRETSNITVHGVTYPNMEEAVRTLDPPASPKTIFRWLASGIQAEEAFARVPNPGYGEGIVYLVTHSRSEKMYVGITIQSLKRRWDFHIDQARTGHIKDKRSLHAAIRKYGASDFSIRPIDSGSSKGRLEEKEKEWIDRLGTLVPYGFNISPGGTSGGSNPRPVEVDGLTFPSVKAAVTYIAKTRDVSLHAAKARLRKGRIDVRKPAQPGKSLVKTPAYKVWSRIIHCVLNPNSRDYIEGVELYKPWRDFSQFLAAVGQPSKSGMAFARIDKSKGFVPKNCAWMSKSKASKINASYMKKNGLFVKRNSKESGA